MGISIIMCCYNSASRLPETLKHIAGQKGTEGMNWEVILVDNNSSDSTKEVAENEWKKYNSNASFKVVSEPVAGVGFARKKGIYTAVYDYVLFCDDDNWLCDTYVSDSFQALKADPLLAAMGGRGEPVFEVAKPEWFDVVGHCFALGPQRVPGTLYGAGLVVRRHLLINLFEIGFESLLVGRKGSSVSSVEDFEYVYFFQILGYKVDYLDRLRFGHFISKDKLTEAYLHKLFAGFGQAYPTLACYGAIFSKKETPPKKQWSKLLSQQVVNTPLVFLFGKSRPRKAHLIMNIESIRALWAAKDSFEFHHRSILKWQKTYQERYPLDVVTV